MPVSRARSISTTVRTEATASDSVSGDLLAGVVRFVDVDQAPRPDTVELKHGFAVGLRVVVHTSGDRSERASRQRLHLRLVELLGLAVHQETVSPFEDTRALRT